MCSFVKFEAARVGSVEEGLARVVGMVWKVRSGINDDSCCGLAHVPELLGYGYVPA